MDCTQTGLERNRALLLGHFSTVGDIQCLHLVERRVRRAGIPYDIAAFESDVRGAIPGAISPESANPELYSHLIIICGPYWPAFLNDRNFDIGRYQHCKRIGINLTMIKPLAEWNPFDVLLERDSENAVRPDLTFLAPNERLPVLGRCLVRGQEEYGDRQRHNSVISIIENVIEQRGFPVIDVDTRWPKRCNTTKLPSPAAVSSLISRTDVLLTNRLHGLVFALRNGVPALAIDAVAGGDKVTAQARVLGWPICLQADHMTPEAMHAALDWCLSGEARAKAQRSSKTAVKLLRNMDREIANSLNYECRRTKCRSTIIDLMKFGSGKLLRHSNLR